VELFYRSAKIARKPDKSGGIGQSMGFAFVEFKHNKHAKDAIKTLQNHSLHDHNILLKPSKKTMAQAEERQVRVNFKLRHTQSQS
jgi:RNA recognition motif-containing protein